MDGVRSFSEWAKDETMAVGEQLAVLVQGGATQRAVQDFRLDAQREGFRYLYDFARGQNTFVMLEKIGKPKTV